MWGLLRGARLCIVAVFGKTDARTPVETTLPGVDANANALAILRLSYSLHQEIYLNFLAPLYTWKIIGRDLVLERWLFHACRSGPTFDGTNSCTSA